MNDERIPFQENFFRFHSFVLLFITESLLSSLNIWPHLGKLNPHTLVMTLGLRVAVLPVGYSRMQEVMRLPLPLQTRIDSISLPRFANSWVRMWARRYGIGCLPLLQLRHPPYPLRQVHHAVITFQTRFSQNSKQPIQKQQIRTSFDRSMPPMIWTCTLPFVNSCANNIPPSFSIHMMECLNLREHPMTHHQMATIKIQHPRIWWTICFIQCAS